MSALKLIAGGLLILGCTAYPQAASPQVLPPGQARFLCQTESQCSQAAAAHCGTRFEVIRKTRVAESEPRGMAMQSNGTRWEYVSDRNRKVYTPRKAVPDLEMVVWCPAETESPAG